jgi:hypothetical protein
MPVAASFREFHDQLGNLLFQVNLLLAVVAEKLAVSEHHSVDDVDVVSVGWTP